MEAQEPTRIFFEVSDLEDIIDRIENGKTLNVQVRAVAGAAENYSYPLDQAREAFEATRQCVNDHAAAADTGQSTSAGDEPSKEGSGVAKEEATAEETVPEGEEQSADSNVTAGPRYELPLLGSKVIETMEVPGWEAAAFSGDDGAFTHCGIKAEYQNGATLGVARAVNGDLVLAVQQATGRSSRASGCR